MESRFLGIAELRSTPSVAVVVDVMRAFTVAAWAFARGAEKIVLAGSPDEALALKARNAEGVRLGVHPDDIALCLELDRFPFAMVATQEDALTVLRPHRTGG
ncbi:2-phosphosulfolactate phosphatase [Streptomyces sp. 196(2019)]|uniref:2-phosphosulfolactate phosphatase n=1 Tax=Streptomyces sp. 196(2019) TaxID=2683820 RepID=UPI0013ED8515|nr:hypothetical protein [Streptomyces sp. 196(2019)]